MAAAVPEQHVATRHAVDIVAQIVVGTEDELLVLRQTVHHLLRVARSDHHVCERLHGSRSVHVAHHLVARVLRLELLQVLSLARVRKRAAGCEVGAEHLLLRRKQLACLSHEVHAAHHDDLSVGLCSLARQCQRVADEIGHLLHFAHRIVVSQHHCVLLLTQATYLLLQVNGSINRLVDVTLLFPIVVHISLFNIVSILYCGTFCLSLLNMYCYAFAACPYSIPVWKDQQASLSNLTITPSHHLTTTPLQLLNTYLYIYFFLFLKKRKRI